MALSAVHVYSGRMGCRDGVVSLIHDFPARPVPEELVAAGLILDGYNVSTMYPDAFSSGAPGDHFDDLQSSEAIQFAGALIEFARQTLAGQARN